MSTERVIRELRYLLAEAGLSGSFLVRNLATGEEIGIDPDRELPVASLVKVPLAVAVSDRLHRGELDGATRVEITPGRTTSPGPAGLSQFRHPAAIAIDDLLYLTVAISDNAAADVLFDLVPPAEVHRAVREAGIAGIAVRHRLSDLAETPAERLGPGDTHLAHSLAIGSRTAGGGHPVQQLDVSRANSGSARAFVDLLQALWVPSRVPPEVAGRVRSLMARNVIRHRLAPDFACDASTWSSKTGTLLNLRHEVGVVEHEDGDTFAVAMLTESAVPAALQPAAEALMSRVARALHDRLRGG
ncbi:class A beta-lactamase-related serine hydrolase [Streptomyces sp. SL13]|uniref:Class A beta-lactamase-related serine hydrolase n=1 Tax=Streptantibioticus silvisoli TaxID=2705255 RepID=A0AA90GW06_9ACTN|nr:serine hydrolase [Streptantibioticus silvisoli]MDI5968874.1 class A beta-lactamase-related serine hydrolase [Streptantibioticus silvisoli]